MNALTRRAQAVLNDKTVDPQSRAIIRYAMEIHDPWLARLVRRAEAGEEVVENMLRVESEEDDQGEAEMICRGGDEPAIKSAALALLMSCIETAMEPRTAANTTKHVALSRCGELNYCGVTDAQIATFASELLRE